MIKKFENFYDVIDTFNIGDRVEWTQTLCLKPKLKGTIIETDSTNVYLGGRYVGIEFDENMGGHSCDGKGKEGYCYRVLKTELKKLDSHEEIKEEDIEWF